ncbi:type I glyceraldehyde-3-phosphate dehydrogenase [Lentimicrobium sp. S6]|uniref:type I glyceraldehyde-3-phosphate dehydrogenase n=1 Tax=Lentimicrobium sp. S6 TaxID=2735872 RepID=UPI001555F0E0|nr:type I glyceraldehyde-3-phosphate dehydrogenase [Lentimicrobium sp. S6]NPD43953.1 type I glyceraldehyde-3-phosphate dehydrogenase [Lentimicrobium sp. S6]
MSKIRLAINGFGRIGRATFRLLINHPNISVIAINDLTDTYTLSHLLKYDTVHRAVKAKVDYDENHLIVNDQSTLVLKEKNPQNLPWADLDIDVVIESTGLFATKDKAGMHLQAGAKKVIISAPAKDDEEQEIPFIVLGVNDKDIDKNLKIISNASCTTNNVAPLIKILDENWGIEKGFITTVHSYTKDQNILDGPHKDLRRGRTAAENIVPTTTGAAKAVTRIFPHLDQNLGGAGIRVPVPDGSLTDLTCTLAKPATIEEINEAFKIASETTMKGILEYTEDPIVSRDVIGNSHSAVFDAQLTAVLGDKNKLVKVIAWYDNEMGYSNRLVDLVERFV